MKRLTGSMLTLFAMFVAAMSGTVVAQDTNAAMMPPKVLMITREYTKPGKSGAQHTRTESNFVQAMMRAKWPTHYLAVESLSGPSRALFLTGYDSFAAWEKDTLATQKNAALEAELDKAWAIDGELLSETDSGAFALREEYSLHPEVDIAHSRYFEISKFQVRQGHDKDWDALVKLVTEAYKRIPDAKWITYSSVYGNPDTTYIIFNAMKSASEIDRNFAMGKDFEAAMGEAGMKKLAELTAAAVESSQTNLFAFNPRMSYPREEWVKADPEFWKPKGASAPAAAKKPAEKPADSH